MSKFSKVIYFLCSFLLLPSSFAKTSQGTYCTAIRGNGQLAPAHSGALANIIEKEQAIPVGGAGGSSASITLFMLDAITQSPIVALNKDFTHSGPFDKNSLIKLRDNIDPMKTAFLVKTILPHFQMAIAGVADKLNIQALASISKTANELKSLLKTPGSPIKFDTQFLLTLNKINNPVLLQKVNLVLSSSGNMLDVAQSLIDDYYLDELTKPLTLLNNILANKDKIDAQTVSDINSLISKNPLFQVRFDNFMQSLNVFGAFDAQKDPDMFFRTGIINFQKFAELLSKAMSLYTHPDITTQCVFSESKNRDDNCTPWAKKMLEFVNSCQSEISVPNKSAVWFDSTQIKCQTDFQNIVTEYYQTKIQDIKNTNNLIEKPIGSNLAMVAATSLLTGQSATDATNLLQEFQQKGRKVSKQAKNFSARNGELRFGYWYDDRFLLEEPMKQRGNGVKADLFYKLGAANWRQVLAISPAEPGLTSIQPFIDLDGEKDFSKGIVSVAGWSDPSPGKVLQLLQDKNGKNICDRTVTITREGPESLFIQSTYLRISGLKNSLKIKKIPELNECSFPTEIQKSFNTFYEQQITKTNNMLVFDWLAYINYNDCIELDMISEASPWYEMYYPWSNGQISAKTYVAETDDVICTNWDQFAPLQGANVNEVMQSFSDLAKNGYYGQYRSDQLSDRTNRVGCWW